MGCINYKLVLDHDSLLGEYNALHTDKEYDMMWDRVHFCQEELNQLMCKAPYIPVKYKLKRLSKLALN